MARAKTVTLTADTVATVTIEASSPAVEVVSVDGAAAVWVRNDGTNPTVAGDDCEPVVAAASSLVLYHPTGGGAHEVRLISSGTPQVCVRAVTRDGAA